MLANYNQWMQIWKWSTSRHGRTNFRQTSNGRRCFRRKKSERRVWTDGALWKQRICKIGVLRWWCERMRLSLFLIEKHGSKQCEIHGWHVNANLGIETRTWQWILSVTHQCNHISREYFVAISDTGGTGDGLRKKMSLMELLVKSW